MCRTWVLLTAGRYDHEIDNALLAFIEAQQRYADSAGAAEFVHDFDQAEAHYDRLSWDALVRHQLAPHPSFLYSFLTTDDPSCAVRVHA